MMPHSHHHTRRFLLCFILFLFCRPFFAQDTLLPKTDESAVQQQLENIAENTENEDADYSNLLDLLQQFREHPINLNSTTAEELRQLQILYDIQISSLLRHIRKTGKLISIYELQGIEGFDLLTIQRILPYVRVADHFDAAHFSIHEMFRSGKHTVQLRYGRVLEQQKGFTALDSAALSDSPNSRYIGSPDKIYLRYRFTYGTNVSWGLTAEKDQGELFFKDRQRFKYDWYEASLKGNQKNGFDFYSAHLYLRNLKFIKVLALGDYHATFGQGLTIWTGYAFGKSADIMGTKKSAAGIRPSTSADENRFLRGAAATYAFKKFEATAFASYKKVDANVSDTTADGEILLISSLQETGYHSTAAELADRHSIGQAIYGGNLAYRSAAFSIGVTAVHYALDKELKRDLSYYNQFEFSGRQNTNAGLDYNLIVRNFNFFGEGAISSGGGSAFMNGVLISLDPRVSFTAVHRYYQRNYQNLLANGFAESSSPSNEKGLYTGLVIRPASHFTVTAYYDRFEFPWLKYQVDAPSRGKDLMAQLNFTPTKKFDAYFRIRSRSKFKTSASDLADIDFIVPYEQINYRINTSLGILPWLRLKNRIELVDYKVDDDRTEKGFMAYQDISFSKPGRPFSFSLRYAVFQTESYNTRIYAYEADMPGVYSIPAYYNRGSRFYLLLDYNITRSLEVWLRYSQTLYDNQNVISEGSLTEINGNRRSEIRAQVRYKF